VLSARAVSDLERFVAFEPSEPAEVRAHVDGILSALRMLEPHPLVGRPSADGLRELIISRHRRGYVALYRFDEKRDLVRVLTLRHQREAGYPGR
jgi:plasmid stabilization system protein ParE